MFQLFLGTPATPPIILNPRYKTFTYFDGTVVVEMQTCKPPLLNSDGSIFLAYQNTFLARLNLFCCLDL